jgi:signal transduction histidine kinase/ActR/RegA family two-component response regulator
VKSRRPDGADFAQLLESRLEDGSEQSLVVAYEAGRRALEQGESLLDLLSAFGAVLLARLETDSASRASDTVRAALDIIGEAAAPFQMTIEGYRSAMTELEEANRRLELTKERLEERVRERTGELEAAKAVAEAASNAKSEFLSRMSHELRTPLNAVLGFAQLLGLDDLSSEQREALTEILKGGRHLLELINEILDLARIEAGQLSLKLQPVSIADVVADCLGLLAPLAAQHEVSLRVDPATDPVVHVRADGQRLAQIIINLVSNAVKYNRPGGDVTIRWEVASSDEVRLAVKDTGVGIAAPLLARLFQPFDRLEANPSIEGTGLGLALSRRLVEAMGGRIGVESEPGQGSTFWVDLVADGVAPRADPESERASLSRTDLPGPREVLYIEDNRSNVELVKRLLDRLGSIALVTAENGHVGLDLAVQHRPSLILLDLHLPDMSGEEVLARLRSDPRTHTIPVIAVTADATPGWRTTLLAGGAAECLTKPIDVPVFLAAVSAVLADQPASSAPGSRGALSDGRPGRDGP